MMNHQTEEVAVERKVESGNVTSRDGTRLYTVQSMHPEGRAILLFVHGYADHTGRYAHVFDWFHERGWSCAGVDLRGHGRSAGQRGFVSRFGEYVDDVEAAVHMLVEQHPDEKLILVGHSMGGLVVLSYLLRHPEGIEGAVLSSPYLGLAMRVPPVKEALAHVMSRVWPTLALETGIQSSDLTHDKAFADAYDLDPLVNHKATARWFTEALHAQRQVAKDAHQVQTPVLVLQAGADRIVDPETSRQVYEAIGATDKEWKSYEQMFHEMFNEVEREQPLSDIAEWLAKHA
jgi:lysophospholipase